MKHGFPRIHLSKDLGSRIKDLGSGAQSPGHIHAAGAGTGSQVTTHPTLLSRGRFLGESPPLRVVFIVRANQGRLKPYA
eukprot:502392-Prorocentrum_minimum.AAC.2